MLIVSKYLARNCKNRMNRWKNDDVTATTREAIRLVDQYESDEAYARRLHEELNGGEDADLQPPRRPQPYRFGPVSNRIESVSNVGEMRQELQRASEDITNINAPELIRHLSFSSEVDDMIPTSSGFDGNRFIQAETEQDYANDTAPVIFQQISSTDSSSDDSSDEDGGESDQRLHDIFSGLLHMMLQRGQQGLTPAQIDQLPTQKLREAFTEYDCPVCMDELARDDQVRRLPCLHILHSDCIDPWLKENNECPTCKFNISSIFKDNDSDDSL